MKKRTVKKAYVPKESSENLKEAIAPKVEPKAPAFVDPLKSAEKKVEKKVEKKKPITQNVHGEQKQHPEFMPDSLQKKKAVNPILKEVKDAIDVYDSEGKYRRTYSKENHGSQYKDLARSYVNANSE